MPGGPGTIHPLITLTNSETGHGGVKVRFGILQAVCFNLATVESVVNEIHLGGELAAGIFSQDTMRKDAEAVLSKTRDALVAAFNAERFRTMVARIRRSADTPIERPSAAVGLVSEKLGVSEQQRESLLEHFLRDYRPTALGLASSITRVAQDIESPDRAEEFEDYAGALMVDSREVCAAE